MERIIVRRGRYLTFELLRRTFGRDPNVEILWDRRKGAGTSPAGDVNERRSRPPEQWNRLDYIFTNAVGKSDRGGGPTEPPRQ